mmetsp:Transcript_9080/g.22123  ORF Transcript_9080/g.22123 Transcript_9080/m.22123 type:complete len:347 (-) Transcript_9080:588-1628(-)
MRRRVTGRRKASIGGIHFQEITRPLAGVILRYRSTQRTILLGKERGRHPSCLSVERLAAQDGTQHFAVTTRGRLRNGRRFARGRRPFLIHILLPRVPQFGLLPWTRRGGRRSRLGRRRRRRRRHGRRHRRGLLDRVKYLLAPPHHQGRRRVHQAEQRGHRRGAIPRNAQQRRVRADVVRRLVLAPRRAIAPVVQRLQRRVLMRRQLGPDGLVRIPTSAVPLVRDAQVSRRTERFLVVSDQAHPLAPVQHGRDRNLPRRGRLQLQPQPVVHIQEVPRIRHCVPSHILQERPPPPIAELVRLIGLEAREPPKQVRQTRALVSQRARRTAGVEHVDDVAPEISLEPLHV